ncbi:putative O-glycosylation ligase, exosortase A system-associated [Calidifontimicrobium sp. SYSU G02091]|uniref:putative O-glycosylation ligase, exosortase A system-associated n=1 Tax=Calidifontimicrobium sp. SYSU G02091 TaxID=2926421 RepID=UPI001F53A319|nr:putative O-glycosylation ligase, exosortase A system-associated [Calidifontimicrobium sp. SYSU G02091]MCI1193132.1 putative O-glycosylation ligase, exosortase A system-associated [Calidifontimicrobium sp. SYSU G02091]
MRDLFLACVVFGALPFILKRPFWGILMLAWLGYMNPHRLTWGFMFSMPVVQIVAIVTLIGMLVSKETKRMVWSREIAVLVLFIVWMGITTTTAFYQNLAIQQYEKVIKIQILTFMTLLMLTSERKVHLFIWTIALSLGFYGVKGGLFTIVNGGVYRVQGPEGTFIGGNNELALALVMTIPLMRYLYLHEKQKLIKLGLAAAMVLTAIAAFGTQSRGALVALVLTGGIFWLKSRHKFVTAILIATAAGVALSVMPAEWYERMSTIKTYQEDGSAQGRINQWGNAINIANDRITGGGFETWQRPVCERYAPNPNDCRDVHSIYFEVLGEHGWIGLAIFLTLLGMTWLKCSSIIRRTKKDPALLWARDLAAMVQVSMVAYLSAGAFLGLAYFDYIYHLVAVVVVTNHLVGQATKSAPSAVGAGLPARRDEGLQASPPARI